MGPRNSLTIPDSQILRAGISKTKAVNRDYASLARVYGAYDDDNGITETLNVKSLLEFSYTNHRHLLLLLVVVDVIYCY